MIWLPLLLSWGAALAIWVPTWAIICVHHTSSERQQIIYSWVHRALIWGNIAAAYNAVTFHRHFWTRCTFRDPWKLYDPIVLDAIKNPRTEVIGMGTLPPIVSDDPIPPFR